MTTYKKDPEPVSLLRPEQYRVTQQDGTGTTFVRTGTRERQNKEADDEGDRRDGPGCGNGRDDAGGAARAAGSDKRRRRSGSCVGIRPDRDGVALDLDRSPRP